MIMKAVVLDKFATVGLPDFDTPGLGRNWSIVALSQQLIDEKLLKNVHHQESNARSLDLVVIGNENKIALLNLQAFKLFPSHLATSMIRQSLAHHFTEDGSLLFGIQTSGDLFVLTDHLKTVKHIRRPYFIKLRRSAPPWYSRVSRRLSNMVGFLTENNLVVPEEVSSQRIMISSWLATSQKFNGVFPLITSLHDGFAIFCALSPQDCFIFLTSYETALRQRSIGNFKGSSVPGRWHRILMDRSFIRRWLEEKDHLWFEAKLCSTFDEDDREVIGGAMLYAVPVNTEFHLVYGIISKLNSHFRLSWEIIQFELDGPLVGESKDTSSLSLGSRFLARLSSDCTKIAVVINTHVASYVHVEKLPAPFYESPRKLQRRRISFCPHGDYDGTQFFTRECWISDIQWIAEDGYFAVMTQCGCLSIFHSSGSPMIIKTRLSERSSNQTQDEEKSARFYLSVFHRQQISSRPRRGQPPYPTLKWVNSQQVLSCSSGLKIELFSLKRVFNLNDDYYDDEAHMDRCSAMNSEKLVLNDSLTLLYAPVESQASGLSETDKESLPEVDTVDDVRVSVYPASPRRGGKTEGEMEFQQRHNSVYNSLVDTKFKPNFTPAPPASANENEVVVSPVFVYREHKTPVKYVSVEDDEYDIYGDCTTSTSGASGGEEEDQREEIEDAGIDKDVVSTVEKLVASCDEDEEEVKKESTRLFTPTSADLDMTLNNNNNFKYDHSTTSAASIESAPEPEASFDPDHLPSPPATCLSLPDLDTRFDLRIQTKSRPDLTSQPPSTGNTITTVESYSPPFTCASLPTSTDEDDARKNIQGEDTWSSQLELKIPSVPSIRGVVVPQRKLASVETFVQTVPVKISELATSEEVGSSPSQVAPVNNNEEKELKEKVVDSSSSAEPVTEEEDESELDIPQVPADNQGFNESSQIEAENNNNVFQYQFDERKKNQKDDESFPDPGNDEASKQFKNILFLSHSCSAVGCQTQTPAPSKDNHGTQTLRLAIKSEREAEVTPPERCRPHCVITEPPPPTSISDTGSLSRTSRQTLQGEQIEFNKAAHDQMAYKSILVPDSIRKAKRRRNKKVTLVESNEVLKKQLTIEQEENNNESRVERSISLSRLSEEAIEKIVAATTEDEIELQPIPSRSKEIWEQAAKQFQQKVNRFVKQKRRRCSSSTSVSIDSELELEDTVKMLGSLPNINGEATCQMKAEPDTNTTERDTFEMKGSQSEQNAQERLISIPKTDNVTKQSRTWNRILWLRNGEPPVEKFQGRTLPYDASSDIELVEELKRRLQKLKFQQEQCKISGNRELTKFMSSWALASESVLPDLNLQDMMIQPVVFPEPVEPSPEIKPELDHQSPLSPPNLSSPAPPPQQQEYVAKEPPQISKSQPVFVFSGPPSVKRNQSHQVVNNKSSTMGMGFPYPHPLLLVPPQTQKKRVHKPQPIYIAPSMQLPLPNFTLRSSKQSQKKAKSTSISAGKATIDLTANRSSSHFVKAQHGKAKITKSPIQTYPLTPRVNSTTSAIIQSAQFQSLLKRKSIKKTGCAACSHASFKNTSNKSDGGDKRRSMKTFVAKVKRVANVGNADANVQRTVDLDKLMDLRGKLPVVPDPVEKVPIGGSSINDTNNSSSQGKGPWIRYNLGESAERDKLARRVSFSDPIAIVKTMSPSDLKATFQLEDPPVEDWTWP